MEALNNQDWEKWSADPRNLERVTKATIESTIESMEDRIMGPYCPWPGTEEDRNPQWMRPGAELVHQEMIPLSEYLARRERARAAANPEVKDFPGLGQMGKNLMKTAYQGLSNKPAAPEVAAERMKTCQACPSFDKQSKRCRECGCFMPLKSKVGGDPNSLCPLKKWVN